MYKRLLTFVSCLLLFSSLAAQVNLSLDLGYSIKDYRYFIYNAEAYDNNLPQGMSSYFAPRVGYHITENVTIGIQLGMVFSDYDYAEGYYNPERMVWERAATTSNRTITAMARGYMLICCFTTGNWSFHAELAGGYSMGWKRDSRSEVRAQGGGEVTRFKYSTVRTLSAQVVPVASYAISRHFGVDFYLNLAALTFASTTTKQWPYGVRGPGAEGASAETTTTTQVFDVGLNSLNTSLLSIGFRYEF